MKLTKKQRNKIHFGIAKMCGFKQSKEKTDQCRVPVLINGEDFYVNWEIPNYLQDLNLWINLERVYLNENWYQYYLNLREICTRKERGVSTESEIIMDCIGASAEQKSIAFAKIYKIL